MAIGDSDAQVAAEEGCAGGSDSPRAAALVSPERWRDDHGTDDADVVEETDGTDLGSSEINSSASAS